MYIACDAFMFNRSQAVPTRQGAIQHSRRNGDFEMTLKMIVQPCNAGPFIPSGDCGQTRLSEDVPTTPEELKSSILDAVSQLASAFREQTTDDNACDHSRPRLNAVFGDNAAAILAKSPSTT